MRQKSKTVWTNLAGFFSLLLLVSACNNIAVYDKTKDVGNGWTASEKVSFLVDIQDSLAPFDFYINVRNSIDYDFSNLFFFIKTVFPDGRYAVDTVNVWLADPKGNWLGSGIGKYRDNKILFKKHGRFPMKGTYRFEFEQAMREVKLDGITSIGIRIENSELKE